MKCLIVVSVLLCACVMLSIRAEEYDYFSDSTKCSHFISPSNEKPIADWPKAKDTVPALGDGDLELIKKGLKNSKDLDKLLSGYVDRMLGSYSKEYKWPEGFVEFLKKNKVEMEIFVTAIDPRYDDPGLAAAIMEELRSADEAKLKKYVHMATALAVVYDHPDSATTGRFLCNWGWGMEQFQKEATYKDNWDFYTDAKNQPRFVFQLEKLPWPILIHLVNNDTSAEERQWVFSKYPANTDIKGLYSSVPYDYSKKGGESKLGKRPYTLANILQYGGVCADQAQFSSRTARTLGVPSMVCGSESNVGSGHSFMGYLVMAGNKPKLEFTGRYFGRHYYTGDCYDYQRRRFYQDRIVAMLYDGVALSYPKYNQSQMMIRMAKAIFDEHPAESLTLVQEGLRLNYFNVLGWPLLMQHIEKGKLSKSEGLKWFNEMLRVLKEHPDMTAYCLKTFVKCISEDDVTARNSLYEQASKLYKERPDLLVTLRMAQGAMLEKAGKKLEAVNVYVTCFGECADEGVRVLPAVQNAVKLAVELNVKKPVSDSLKKSETRLPKECYGDYKKLVDQLK